MGRGLVPHLLEEAALGGALLSLRGFEGVVLELLLVSLPEGFDLLVRGRRVSGDLLVVVVVVCGWDVGCCWLLGGGCWVMVVLVVACCCCWLLLGCFLFWLLSLLLFVVFGEVQIVRAEDRGRGLAGVLQGGVPLGVLYTPRCALHLLKAAREQNSGDLSWWPAKYFYPRRGHQGEIVDVHSARRSKLPALANNSIRRENIRPSSR